MADVTVSRRDDRLIAIKQVGAERASEIDREARLLQRVNHPSVVRFVDLVETPDGGRALHTEFVSSDTWATRPLTNPAERAAKMAALAAAVADLHDVGLAHLRLAPGHVLHGEDDRPVLCGLARAGEATPDNRHADLAALADMCHDDDVARGPLAPKLSSLADAARGGRLSARDLARRLDQLLAKRAPRPEPRPGVETGRFDRIRRAPRRAVHAGAALLVVAAGVAALIGWTSSRPGPTEAGVAPAAPAARRDQAVPAPGTSSLAAPVASRDQAVPAPGASSLAAPVASRDQAVPAPGPSGLAAGADSSQPVDSAPSMDPASPALGHARDGGLPRPDAPAPVEVASAGAVLEHGGRKYAIGAEGDLVATGDWDCDGDATPAIVRPATGDVVLFDGWPGPGETLSMPVRWNVETPVGVEVVHHDSCDLLRVLTASGSQLLDPRRMQ